MRQFPFIFILALLSCDQFEAELPTFIQFNDVQVQPSEQEQPSTHEITDLWIYANQQLLGIYPVTSRIPVLSSNSISLDVFAGIRQNGINQDARLYPFYEKVTMEINASPGSTLPLDASFTYLNSTVCAFYDAFEGALQFQLDLDMDLNTRAQIETTYALLGRSLHLPVGEASPLLEVAQNLPMNSLPTDGSPVFLEMDYRGIGTGIFVGIIGSDRLGNSAKQFKLFLFQNEEWQKIYVDLSPELQASQFEQYQLVFRVIWDAESDLQDQVVILDHLKLLHF